MMKHLSVVAGLLLSLTINAIEDSIGVSIVDGKTYVQHRIGEGETLYRISVNYGVSVQEIVATNPELDGSIYKAGQVILIPRSYILSAPSTASNSAEPVAHDEPVVTAQSHTVLVGETLFSISRQYELTVSELMALNNMTSTDIAEGQVLNVSTGSKEPSTEITSVASSSNGVTEVSGNSQDNTEPTSTTLSNHSSAREKYLLALTGGSYAELQANGAVTWVPQLSPDPNNYFALHRTVPVGSIVKVKNPINSNTIYAKIVGNLPASADDRNLVLKLPSSAKKELRIYDEVMFVEISYLVPKQ